MYCTNPYNRHGLLARLAMLGVALACWLLSGCGLLRRGCAVLCYHGIPDAHRHRFARQMRAIAGRAIRADQLDRPCPGSRLRACVTFDDAFANLLTNALPIMRQLQVPATIFVVSGNLGAKPAWDISADHPEAHELTMTPQQLADASRQGVYLASHTISHPRLSRLSPDEVYEQAAGSRQAVEAIAGREVLDIALPHGDFTPGVVAVLEEAGYTRIHTLEPLVQPLPVDGPLVGRFSMSPEVWPIEFRLTIDGAYQWRIWLRRLLARGRGGAGTQKGYPVAHR